MAVSVKAEKLLTELEMASGNHTWQQDQGYGEAVVEAEKDFDKARKAIRRYIARLESCVAQ